MKIKFKKDGEWKQTETDRLIVFGRSENPIAGMLEQNKILQVSVRGDRDFEEVMNLLDQEIDSQTVTLQIGEENEALETN